MNPPVRNRSHIVIDNRWEHDPNHRRHGGGIEAPGVLPPATRTWMLGTWW